MNLITTEISFGKAKLADAMRISVLMKTVYIQTYADEGITFEFTNFINKRFSSGHIESIINENPSRLIIAYYNNNPIGVVEIIYDSICPVKKIKVPELSKLYVLERFYGRGVGYGLIKTVEKEVMKNGFDQLNLEVDIQNVRAVAFYERQGYISIGDTDLVMEFNTYKNLVMNKKL